MKNSEKERMVVELNEMLRNMAEEKPRVNLFLVHKINNKGRRKFKVINPDITPKFEKELLEMIEKELELYTGMRKVDYNIVGSDTDVIEITKIYDYSNVIDSLINSLKNPNTLSKIRNVTFDFFVYNVCFENLNKELFFFRKIRRFKTFTKGFVGSLVEGIFEKITDGNNLLATDGKIDFAMDDTNVYIFQHISFERVFDLKNEFSVKAKSVLDNVEKMNKIEGFEELRESAMENANYIKRLAKISNEANSNTATLFLEDLKRTKRVIDKFNLDIEVDVTEGKMKFNNKSQTSNYINLMKDAYYETLIGNVKGIDERR